MLDTCKAIYGVIREYYGDLIYLIMAAVAYIYLFIRAKDIRNKLLLPVAMIMFVVVNPVLYMFIFKDIIYWRLFWMFPDALIIAIAFTFAMRDKLKVWIKILVALAFFCAIIYSGKNVYKVDAFEKTSNAYKLPRETCEVGKILLDNDDHVKCIAPRQLYSTLRMYSADIELLYGRNADGYISVMPDKYKRISTQMDAAVTDYNVILSQAIYDRCNYVVTLIQKPIGEDILDRYSFSEIARTASFIVYHLDDEQQFDESWLVTQYSVMEDKKLSFYALESLDGRLIIVDGGSKALRKKVMKVIKEHDYHVDAWILTSCHKDHIGAFVDIFSDEDKLKIDKIIMPEFDLKLLKNTASSESKVKLYEDLASIIEANDAVDFVYAGDKFDLCGLSFSVLNSWSKDIDEDTEKKVMSGSLVFTAGTATDTMLFCSDYNELDSMKLDKDLATSIEIVSAGNHGMDLPKKFYNQIEPYATYLDMCIWCLEDDEEKTNANEIVEYFADRLSLVYAYEKYPAMLLLR